MRLSGRSALRLALPLGAIAVFALLLAFSLIRMVGIQADMRVGAEQNMLWVMHQGETAARRLNEAAILAERGEATAEELALRFDILKSRLALVNDGPQRRFVEEIGLDAEFAEVATVLDTVADLARSATPSDAARLREALAPIPGFLAEASNKAMIAEWDDLGGRLETHRDQLRQIITWLIGIMLAGGVLAAMLIMALRQTRQRNLMLRRAQDFSGLLISSSGEGILAVDRAGRCTLWNPAMAAMIRRSAEQAIGRKPGELAGFFDIAPVRDGIEQALAGRMTELTLQPLFHPGERPLHVDLRFFPMRNESGIIGAITFMRDASDRHAAEQRITEDRNRLEHLVTERTRELDNALQRERSAADLYRNFAAMISHQFRTPLAVADSALQRLIRRGPRAEPTEITERATRARSAIAALTRLVESTLDAARLEAGQVGARRRPSDLGAILAEVCARQRAASPGCRIEISDESKGGHHAFCDPAHAEQVLENLIANAVKYASPGSAVLARLHGNTEMILCDVRNQGPGIAPEDRERIFERNVRGDNSIGTAGAGVGLFIARALARMQGGDVRLEPEMTATVFRLSLPRLQMAETAT
ncbi:MAG TPA: ATP-binding protein [Paracoccaceae bacterium]|nr:ATP-binding protein [Paracoccaceae bacterium]